MKNEPQNKAWELLDEKGLTLGEKMMVKSHFVSTNKEEYPFITIKYKKGDVEYYHSDIKEISNLMF